MMRDINTDGAGTSTNTNTNTNKDLSIEEQANRWFVLMQSHSQQGIRDVRDESTGENTGEGAGDIAAEFESWLNADPAHREAYQKCEDLWSLVGDFANKPEILAARRRIRQQVDNKMSRTRIRRRLWQPMAIAASFVAVLITSFLFTSDIAFQSLWDNGVYQTEIGEQKSITLEDGSTLILDTQTKIATTFSDKIRRVVLEKGQAHFDVAKDIARPFVVEAGNGIITALGTAFVVSKRDSKILVTLIEGKVVVAQERPIAVKPVTDHEVQGNVAGPDEIIEKEVVKKSVIKRDASQALAHEPMPKRQFKNGQKLETDRQPEYVEYQYKLELIAGQQVAYSNIDISTAATVDLERATAWQRGRLIFEDHSLVEVLNELNGYSRKKILLGDASMDDIRITGVFKTGDNEKIVQTLKSYFSFRITSDEDGNIVLLPNRKLRVKYLRTTKDA